MHGFRLHVAAAALMLLREAAATYKVLPCAQVSDFILVNAIDRNDIGILQSSIALDDYPDDSSFNLRVNVANECKGKQIKSVLVQYASSAEKGRQFCEDLAPYTVFGDANTAGVDILDPSVARYNRHVFPNENATAWVRAIPFFNDGCKSDFVGTPKRVLFSISMKTPASTPAPVSDPTPVEKETDAPVSKPTRKPKTSPTTAEPVEKETEPPVSKPTRKPKTSPATAAPSEKETEPPVSKPTRKPKTSPTTAAPSEKETDAPVSKPTRKPETSPTTAAPVDKETDVPMSKPTSKPKTSPTTAEPVEKETDAPVSKPTRKPKTSSTTAAPSEKETDAPVSKPTRKPETSPTTAAPSEKETDAPVSKPTRKPKTSPTTAEPVEKETEVPMSKPTRKPKTSPTTAEPVEKETEVPMSKPTRKPKTSPVTAAPVEKETDAPVSKPTRKPKTSPTTAAPSEKETEPPVPKPTRKPKTSQVTAAPVEKETDAPVSKPTRKPKTSPTTAEPIEQETDGPASKPTGQPNSAPVVSASPSPDGSCRIVGFQLDGISLQPGDEVCRHIVRRSLEAIVKCSTVARKVVLELQGARNLTLIEKVKPYTFGGTEGIYLPIGNYKVSATPYIVKDIQGMKGMIRFSVEKCQTTVPPSEPTRKPLNVPVGHTLSPVAELTDLPVSKPTGKPKPSRLTEAPVESGSKLTRNPNAAPWPKAPTAKVTGPPVSKATKTVKPVVSTYEPVVESTAVPDSKPGRKHSDAPAATTVPVEESTDVPIAKPTRKPRQNQISVAPAKHTTGAPVARPPSTRLPRTPIAFPTKLPKNMSGTAAPVPAPVDRHPPIVIPSTHPVSLPSASPGSDFPFLCNDIQNTFLTCLDSDLNQNQAENCLTCASKAYSSSVSSSLYCDDFNAHFCPRSRACEKVCGSCLAGFQQFVDCLARDVCIVTCENETSTLLPPAPSSAPSDGSIANPASVDRMCAAQENVYFQCMESKLDREIAANCEVCVLTALDTTPHTSCSKFEGQFCTKLRQCQDCQPCKQELSDYVGCMVGNCNVACDGAE